MTPEQFGSSLSLLLDGDLPSAAFEKLEQHLLSNTEARRQYLDYVNLHNIPDLELSSEILDGAAPTGFIPLSCIIRKHKL